MEQEPAAPAHAMLMLVVLAVPGVHVHAAGSTGPPTHKYPGPQPTGEQLPLAPAHANEPVALEASPTLQVQGSAPAAPPAHAKPALHGAHVAEVSTHDTDPAAALL